jgi:hypothetical protein
MLEYFGRFQSGAHGFLDNPRQSGLRGDDNGLVFHKELFIDYLDLYAIEFQQFHSG